MTEVCEKELLFNTESSSIYQQDSSNSFILDFYKDSVCFRFCELLAFRKKLQKIDIEHLIVGDGPDAEIIQLVHCNRFFLLTIPQILELREVINGAFAMMELNSLIHKQLVRKLV